jgi:hypothetical protein
MFNNAKLRLTMPEAYRVHRNIIEWNARFSYDRVPDRALGVDPLTLHLMRFVMGSWRRVEFFNTYMAGTVAPRIQMDFLPSMACAAHFAIKAQRTPITIDDFVAAGRIVQRLWLTATQLGLFQQPEVTPLIFASYLRNALPFTTVVGLQESARELAKATDRILGPDTERVIWMGRLGAGPAPSARSLRRPVAGLIHAGTLQQGGELPRT